MAHGQRRLSPAPSGRTLSGLVLVASVIVGGVAVGCGDGDGDGGAAEGIALISAEVDRAPTHPAAAAAAGEITAALGTDLFAQLPRTGNLALSPYSVAVALAMTRAGAAGATADEMDIVLHATDLPDLHAGFGSLDAALAERTGTFDLPGGEPVELELSFGNAIWPQAGFPFEDPFLEILAGHYGAGVQAVDYVGDTEGARQAINGWVAGETRDRIPELIPPDVLSALTRLVLSNAVYLNAPWLHPFDEAGTGDAAFELLDGATVTAPLMHLDESLPYGAGDGWQAVELPYAGGELAMVVLVPDAGSYETTEAELGPALIASVGAALAGRQVDLRLPSFELRSQLDLSDPLRALGMPTAFTDGADFSAMSPEPLEISDVLQEVFVSVDEKGTEAAAATAVVMDLTAAPADDPVTLVVDRPYLFWITDRETGAVLFLGRVLDPTGT
jgi:serpin B